MFKLIKFSPLFYSKFIYNGSSLICYIYFEIVNILNKQFYPIYVAVKRSKVGVEFHYLTVDFFDPIVTLLC